MEIIQVYLEKIEVKVVAFEITDRAEYREFKLTQGDTYPSVRIQFLDDINDPLDITDWRVDFFFTDSEQNLLLNSGHTQCSIFDAAQGIAEYEWQEGDTRHCGVHFGGFQLTTPEGKRQSIRDTLRFKIRPQIDGVSGTSCFQSLN